MDRRRNRTLLVGWDGATFDVIRPLVENGEMPNVASLMKNGVWGPLESTVPPLTPVAWTSIFTGVNPGKHGIFDAIVYRPDLKRSVFANSTMRSAEPIWSILDSHGKKSGVLNVPMTYPPDETGGFIVSGMFTPQGAADFVRPPELKKELEDKFGPYRIECDHAANPGAFLKLIIEMIDERERAALYLMETRVWDFFFAVFIASDRVQHFFWKYLDPNHPEHRKYGDAVKKVYKRMDGALGRLIEKAGTDANVMMVSDHGAGPIKTAFFLNNWLIKNKYLFLKQDMAEILRASQGSAIRRGIVRSVKKVIPASVLGKLKNGEKGRHQAEINAFSSVIDWERTVAFSEGVSGGIFINPSAIGPERYDEVCDRLASELKALRGPSGKLVVENVYRRAEIYSGPRLNEAPDMTLICSRGFQLIAPNEFLFFRKDYEDSIFLEHRWSGRHERYGIFIMKGPEVRHGAEVNGVRIVDVTPTLLYLLDEPVPDYMDGRVVEEAISEAELALRPVKKTVGAHLKEGTAVELSGEQEKDIAEKLKSLGYIE